MGKYSVIADVSNKLANILTDKLVPELISDKNGIGFCSPQEKGDYVLGIHLYDVARDGELAFSGMLNQGLREQKFPPTVLALFYMITAYSKSDLKFRAIEEQKILGGVIQALADENIISGETLGNDAYRSDVRIEFLNLDLEEKQRIWNGGTNIYQASLFYKITPVELESTKSRTVARVKEFSIQTEENGR